MSESRRCPQCGAELSADVPDAPCPACLIKLGLASWTERAGGESGQSPAATEASSGRFQPPDPEELAGHFPQLEIIELLGVGGMGAVYKARQPGLDRLVALKILPPEVGRDPAFAERFAREARAMARLSHPNIVTIHDSGQADEFYYFVMEFVEGVNLRQMSCTAEFGPQEALAIVPQICEALQYAHDEGIVHRDIKPENILVNKQGRVKIADFGLAKLLGKAPAEFTLTGTGQAMGTPHYMAPEQMQGAGSVDHRADIYSLGVVFYEMLTGQLPIGRFEPPSKKVQVDVRLDEVVLRSLESEPDRRYQQVSQVKTDVQRISLKTSVGEISSAPSPAMTAADSAAQPGVADLDRGRSVVQGPADALIVVAGVALLTAIGVAVWLALVGNSPLVEQQARLTLQLMSATHVIYAVFILPVGLLMRRLRARMLAMLCVTIVGVAVPGMYALNVIMEWGRVPQWPVLIPQWLGVPVAVWVTIVLFRQDVRAAFQTESRRCKRERQSGRPLWAKLAVWTGVLVGLWLYLMPVIWADWWPTIYNEHFEVGLEPGSGAYQSAKVRSQRKLYCWGQHEDRPITKNAWIAKATIAVSDPKSTATMQWDPFVERWQWTSPVGEATSSRVEPSGQFVADGMQAAGIDTTRPGVREEAAELIDLLKNAGLGISPGGKNRRATGPPEGTRIGSFTSEGTPSWGIFWVGPVVDFRLVAAIVFLAVWSPVVLVMVRRHRRPASKASTDAATLLARDPEGADLPPA